LLKQPWHGGISTGKSRRAARPYPLRAGNVDRLITNALEIGVDLETAKQEPEIYSHGLLHPIKSKAASVDLAQRS